MRKLSSALVAVVVLFAVSGEAAFCQNFDNGNPVPFAAGFPFDIGSDDVLTSQPGRQLMHTCTIYIYIYT